MSRRHGAGEFSINICATAGIDAGVSCLAVREAVFSFRFSEETLAAHALALAEREGGLGFSLQSERKTFPVLRIYANAYMRKRTADALVLAESESGLVLSYADGGQEVSVADLLSITATQGKGLRPIPPRPLCFL